MTKNTGCQNCLHEIGKNQNEDVLYSKCSARRCPSETIIQQLHYLESEFIVLHVFCVNMKS